MLEFTLLFILFADINFKKAREYWSNGVMDREETPRIPLTQYSNTPFFR